MEPLYFRLRPRQTPVNPQNSLTSRPSSKFLGMLLLKHPTTPQTQRHTTLWNVNIRKSRNNLKNINAIYDISQSIVATGFKCGKTSDYDFLKKSTAWSALKEF